MNSGLTHPWKSALGACLVAIFVPIASLTAQVPIALHNGGFEDGMLGAIPPGWALASKEGMSAEIRAGDAAEGRQFAVVGPKGEKPGARTASLYQYLDPAGFKGKRIRLRAFLRMETRGPATGSLWLRVDLPHGRSGLANPGEEGSFRATSWTSMERVIDVPQDAHGVSLGVLAQGGPLCVDGVSLEVLGDAPTPESARPLDERGLSNLVAFARAYGDLRFFHPSDESAAADWEDLAWKGVRAVEDAPSPAVLAQRLQRLFMPIAPTAAFFVKGRQTPKALCPTGAFQVVRWKHFGLGLRLDTLYSSVRDYAPIARLTKDWSDLAKPRVYDLGGGVQLEIPLVCRVDKNHRTLPLTGSPAKLNPCERPLGDPEDRASRLASILIAWNVIQHFYPNFDWASVDWDAALPDTLRRVALDTPEAFLADAQRMMARLEDGHAHVIPLWRGTEGGPGVQLTFVGGDLVVCGREEGLKDTIFPGDLLLAINGRSCAQVVADLLPTLPASSEHRRRALAAQLLLNGERGVLALTLRGADGAVRTVNVPRPFAGRVPSEPRPDALTAEPSPGVGYVDLSRMDQTSVASVVDLAGRVQVLILDMRGYPVFGAWQALFGHFTDNRLESCAFMVPVPRLPNREGLGFSTLHSVIEPSAPRLHARLIFLADARAVSQSEYLLDFVDHYKLGVIVGEATAGVNGNVNHIDAFGLRYDWTGMKAPRYDGQPFARTGIVPTIPCSRTLAGIRDGRDEILERALELARNYLKPPCAP